MVIAEHSSQRLVLRHRALGQALVCGLAALMTGGAMVLLPPFLLWVRAREMGVQGLEVGIIGGVMLLGVVLCVVLGLLAAEQALGTHITFDRPTQQVRLRQGRAAHTTVPLPAVLGASIDSQDALDVVALLLHTRSGVRLPLGVWPRHARAEAEVLAAVIGSFLRGRSVR